MKRNYTLILLACLLFFAGNSFGQIQWANTGASTAWYTAANWSPNTASGAWTASNIAQFANAGTANTAGINMGTASLSIGAIEITSARTRILTIGSSSSNGSLTLNGTTVNSVSNVILRNNSNQLLTVQNNETGSGKTMNVVLANTTENVINIDGSGGITISSIISGTSRNLTKAGIGNGVLTLSGVNTYTGTTKISSGILQLGIANALPIGNPGGGIIFNGGTLSTGATTGFSNGTSVTNNIGTLTLNDNSTIALGTGSHNLYFAASNAVSWTSGKVLTITGWTGTVAGCSAGTAGKIFVGSSATTLTAAQLAQIKFTILGIDYPATLLSTGELVPTLKLVVTNPGNQTAGTGFVVTVTTTDFNGTARNVPANTGITLTSTNAISGTTTGTINSGSSTTTDFSGVILEAGINATTTATASSGSTCIIIGTSGTFDVTSSGSPSLAITGTTAHGSVCPGTAATPITYNITNSGGATAAGITVVSSDPQFVVSGLSSTSIAASGGTATYNVTFTPSSAGAKTATITVSSTTSGSNSPTSSLTGTGTATVAQAVTTTAAGSVSYSSATLNGNVTALGVCPASIEKGFVYSVTTTNASPAVGGTGVTQVPVGTIGTGTFNTGLTGLPSSTQYSYTAYVFDGTTYTYGTTLTFTTLNAFTLSGTLAHGSVCPGSSTSAITYTITNNSISTITGVAVGSNNTEFVVSGLSSTSIAAGGTATYQVTFTPSAAGARSATITVSGTSATSVTNTVTGTGTATVAQAVTTSAAGSVSYSSATLNGSVTTLGICPASIEKGFVYSVTTTNNAPIVGGTGVTKIAVGSISTGTFNTGLTGLPSSTQYSFTAYVYNGTTYTYGATLTFTTLNPLTLSGTLAHGSACIGASTSSITYTITNNSISTITGVAVGSNNTEFVVSSLSSTSIAAGGTATYQVTFTPSASGSRSATITVSGTSVTSVTNTVTGTGIATVAQAVTTSAASSVSLTSATLNGNVTTLGVCPSSIEKGFVYSVTATNASPTVGGTGVTKVVVGTISTGTYNTGLIGLTSSTQYSFTSYVYDGTTYTYGTTLTFMTLTPIVNDECTGAISITPSSDLTCTGTSGSIANATQSIAPITTFTGTSAATIADVWYRFTATSATHVVYVTSSASMDAVVDVRSGSCDGTSIGNSDDYGTNGLETVPLNGLSIGSTYYVRIYHYKSASGDAAIPADPTFTICVTTPCLYESFTGTTFPPTGWLSTGVTRSTTLADYNTSPGAASFNSNSGSLTTTVIANPATLKFYLGRSGSTTAKTLTIDVSTTSQSSGFTTIATYNNSNVPVSSYDQYTVDLSAYSTNSTVWVRFTKSSSTTSPWRLDDVAFSCAPACTLPANPNGSISGSTTACGNSTLSYTHGSGQPVSGVSYYWQTSASGTSTANNANDDFDVTSSGNYYVRAKNDGEVCWSALSTTAYSVTIINTTTTIAPSADQNIVSTVNGTQLTVTEGSTATREWLYTTTSGSGYISFIPAQTGINYTPNFASAGTYYVVSASSYTSCGTIYSNEVKVTVIAPGPPVITHTPLISTNSTSTQTATATIASTTPLTCTPTLTYRVDGGAWQTPINGTLSGGIYSFPIPGQVAGSMIEYFITACNSAGTVTSPTGVSTSSPYGSFHEYTINCTPASSGTQTIAFQGFEFVGSSGYTFSVDNTNTAPTGAQNYPAHPSAVEWKYYNQKANGSLTDVTRNSCGCLTETFSGLPGCPNPANPIYTAGGSTGICRTFSVNSRGVYGSTSATENPANSRSRNGNYSYLQISRNDGGDGPISYIYFDDIAIPDATNATNIKVIAYVSSISTTTLGNGAETADYVTLSAAYNSSGATNTMVNDITCGSDWYFNSSNLSSTVTGTSNQRWDYAGNIWNTTPAISSTTTKNMITLNIPNGTTNVRAMIKMLNDDGNNTELWAVDDIQIIADYPTVTPTTGRYYRSRQNGKWNAISTWEVSTLANFSSPQNACEFPTFSNSDSIIIMPGHTVRITANQTADQLRVATGAKLILENYNLTIYNDAGTDFVINGTFEDNSVGNSLSYNASASWSCTSGATIIKSSSSAVTQYRDNYATGIANIPADAFWYYRYKGVGSTNTVTVGMFYPNLYFENAFNTNNYSFNSSSTALTGTTGGYCTVKGDLNIGTGGTGTVSVFNNNINSQPMLILGDMNIGIGSTLTTVSYDGIINSNHGNGTGFEVKGNVTINGALNVNTSSTGILKFSGNGTQTVSGIGTTVNLWNVELNKPTQTLVNLSRNLTVSNNLNFNSGGIIRTNSNVITVSNSSTNSITGFEAPFTASSGTPSYVNDKYVWGKLERSISAPATYTYPVGDVVPSAGVGEGYNPLRIDVKSTAATNGFATAEFIPGSPGIITVGPIFFTCSGVLKFYQYSAMTGEGKWRMTSSSSSTFDYDIYLHPNGVNVNTNPNDDILDNGLYYKNIYRALKATNGTTDWSAFAGGGDKCIVGYYYNIPGVGYSGFSDFAPAGGNQISTALPVELTSFTGTCIGNGISKITWSTASELNSRNFLLQRSSDGSNFTTVANVNAAGNSNQTINYTVYDSSLITNGNYYRLIEVDFDGIQTIYSFISIECREVDGMNIYYNQPKVVVEINSNTDRQVLFNVYEISGKLLHQENKQVIRGYNRFNLGIEKKLVDGIYIIQMIDGKKISSSKLWVH